MSSSPPNDEVFEEDHVMDHEEDEDPVTTTNLPPAAMQVDVLLPAVLSNNGGHRELISISDPTPVGEHDTPPKRKVSQGDAQSDSKTTPSSQVSSATDRSLQRTTNSDTNQPSLGGDLSGIRRNSGSQSGGDMSLASPGGTVPGLITSQTLAEGGLSMTASALDLSAGETPKNRSFPGSPRELNEILAQVQAVGLPAAVGTVMLHEKESAEKIQQLNLQVATLEGKLSQQKERYETTLSRYKSNLSASMDRLSELNAKLRSVEQRAVSLEEEVEPLREELRASSYREEAVCALVMKIDTDLHTCARRVMDAAAKYGDAVKPADQPQNVAAEYTKHRDHTIQQTVQRAQRSVEKEVVAKFQQKAKKERQRSNIGLPGGGSTRRASKARRSSEATSADFDSSTSSLPTHTMQLNAPERKSGSVRFERGNPFHRTATVIVSGGEKQNSDRASSPLGGPITRKRSVKIDDGIRKPSFNSRSDSVATEDSDPIISMAPDEMSGANIGFELSHETHRDFRRISLTEFMVRDESLRAAKGKAADLKEKLERATKEEQRLGKENVALKARIKNLQSAEMRLRSDIRRVVAHSLQHSNSSQQGPRGPEHAMQLSKSMMIRYATQISGEGSGPEHLSSAASRDIEQLRVENNSPSSRRGGNIPKLPSMGQKLASRGGATSMTSPTKSAGLTPRPPPMSEGPARTSYRHPERTEAPGAADTPPPGSANVVPLPAVPGAIPAASDAAAVEATSAPPPVSDDPATSGSFHLHDAQLTQSIGGGGSWHHYQQASSLPLAPHVQNSATHAVLAFKLLLSAFVQEMMQSFRECAKTLEGLNEEAVKLQLWMVEACTAAAQAAQSGCSPPDSAAGVKKSKTMLEALQAANVSLPPPPLLDLELATLNFSDRAPSFENSAVVKSLFRESAAALGSNASDAGSTHGSMRSAASMSRSVTPEKGAGAAADNRDPDTAALTSWADEVALLRSCWFGTMGFLQQHAAHFQSQIGRWHFMQDEWLSGRIIADVRRTQPQQGSPSPKASPHTASLKVVN